MIGMMSFSDWSFAAEDTENVLETVWKMLYLIVNILSWVWVFFAKWAGEFLTNKWVYGEVIWLDVILWQYRNVVKNMANFGLWFYFIYEIWMWILNKSNSGIDKLKNKLVWLLVAGIWIQASWFMTAVVIDISTITLSAAWAFPSMLVSESQDIKNSFSVSMWNFFEEGKELWKQISKWMEFWLFLPDMGQAKFTLLTKGIDLKEPIPVEDFYDKILPSADSVSWPLYYLWFSILKTSTITSPQATDEAGWKAMIFNTLLQWWTTVIYSIEMLVLLVFSVMRVVYMWVFISISPIIVLLWCIEQASGKWGNSGFIGSLTKHFNLSSFFWNAFKPTIIVLWFSLSMIFVSLISTTIIHEGQKFDMWWLETQNRRNGWSTDTGQWDYKYDTIFNGENAEILIQNWWKSLFDFILCVITVILVYVIIKFAVNMWWWKDFVSEKIQKFQWNVEAWIGTMPIVPVSWWDKDGNKETHYLSAGTVFWIGNLGNPTNQSNLIDRRMAAATESLGNYNSSQADALNNFLGWANKSRLTESDITSIENAWWIGIWWTTKLSAMKNAMKKSKEGYQLKLNQTTWDPRWIKIFEKWLKDTEEWDINKVDGLIDENDVIIWKWMIDWWKKNENDRTLEKMFMNSNNRNEKRNVQVYAKFFGLGDGVDSWQTLKDRDITIDQTKESE